MTNRKVVDISQTTQELGREPLSLNFRDLAVFLCLGVGQKVANANWHHDVPEQNVGHSKVLHGGNMITNTIPSVSHAEMTGTMAG